jgi:hypothetical protein
MIRRRKKRKAGESLVKEFHTLGGEGDPIHLQAAYLAWKNWLRESLYKLRFGWCAIVKSKMIMLTCCQ